MIGFDLEGKGMTSARTRARLIERLREANVASETVLGRMSAIPRHIFVDEALAHRAYEDTALPIGHGQTISQPLVVAQMTSMLLNVPRARILEIGTGCGYQTAVLAGLVRRVYSIERIGALLPRTRERLSALRITNATIQHGDGYQGWPVHAPFDGILLTAAPPEVPQALFDQLAPGGRLIAPVGEGDTQQLVCWDLQGEELVRTTHSAVHFVPLKAGVARQ